MEQKEIHQIKNIIANLEFAIEKLNDLNSQLGQQPNLYDFKKFGESMTLIKDAKTISYKLIEVK